jgi:hypothetical protein
LDAATGQTDPMSLYDEGFRFVIRADGAATWLHPALLRPDDIDCTDMPDDDFASLYLKINTPKSVDSTE